MKKIKKKKMFGNELLIEYEKLAEDARTKKRKNDLKLAIKWIKINRVKLNKTEQSILMSTDITNIHYNEIICDVCKNTNIVTNELNPQEYHELDKEIDKEIKTKQVITLQNILDKNNND